MLDALRDTGLEAEFVQICGMCAALDVVLDGGHYLRFTDREDTLSWERGSHDGWFIGLYEPEERRTIDGPLRWLVDDDGTTAAAVVFARRVLRGEGRV